MIAKWLAVSNGESDLRVKNALVLLSNAPNDGKEVKELLIKYAKAKSGSRSGLGSDSGDLAGKDRISFVLIGGNEGGVRWLQGLAAEQQLAQLVDVTVVVTDLRQKELSEVLQSVSVKPRALSQRVESSSLRAEKLLTSV